MGNEKRKSMEIAARDCEEREGSRREVEEGQFDI